MVCAIDARLHERVVSQSHDSVLALVFFSPCLFCAAEFVGGSSDRASLHDWLGRSINSAAPSPPPPVRDSITLDRGGAAPDQLRNLLRPPSTLHDTQRRPWARVAAFAPLASARAPRSSTTGFGKCAFVCARVSACERLRRCRRARVCGGCARRRVCARVVFWQMVAKAGLLCLSTSVLLDSRHWHACARRSRDSPCCRFR